MEPNYIPDAFSRNDTKDGVFMKSTWRSVIITLILTAILIGCSGKTSREEETDEPTFTVGIISSKQSYINANLIVETAGGKLINGESDFSPDSLVRAVEKLIASGCDGVMFTPMSDSSLSFIVEMCEEAHVYWTISLRAIHDARIRKQVEESPYFVGMVMENDEAVGYEIMSVLGEQGAKKVAVFSTTTLDTTGAARERGMSLAAAEQDMDVVAIIRNPWRSEDVSASVKSLMDAYPDLDAIYRVGTFAWGTSTAILNAICDAKKADRIRYVTADLEEELGVFFDRGIISVATGGHIPLDSSLAAALLVNTLMGSPLKEDGSVTLQINPLVIRSGDELRAYYSVVDDGTAIFSAETAKQKLMKWLNTDLTVQSFQELIDNYSIEAVSEWKRTS